MEEQISIESLNIEVVSIYTNTEYYKNPRLLALTS